MATTGPLLRLGQDCKKSLSKLLSLESRNAMGSRYTAAFILPAPNVKRLEEDGWLIESADRLNDLLLEKLTRALGLQQVESEDGIDVHASPAVKLIALRDSDGRIEQIFAQLTELAPDALRLAVQKIGLNDVEVFVPAQPFAPSFVTSSPSGSHNTSIHHRRTG